MVAIFDALTLTTGFELCFSGELLESAISKEYFPLFEQFDDFGGEFWIEITHWQGSPFAPDWQAFC